MSAPHMPHDSTNPHNVRQARDGERPFRRCDPQMRPSDMNHFAPSPSLLEHPEDVALLDEYVKRSIQSNFENNAFDDFKRTGELLRRYGLTTSPYCEHREKQRVWTCTEQMVAHARRMGAHVELCLRFQTLIDKKCM